MAILRSEEPYLALGPAADSVPRFGNLEGVVTWLVADCLGWVGWKQLQLVDKCGHAASVWMGSNSLY